MAPYHTGLCCYKQPQGKVRQVESWVRQVESWVRQVESWVRQVESWVRQVEAKETTSMEKLCHEHSVSHGERQARVTRKKGLWGGRGLRREELSPPQTLQTPCPGSCLPLPP